MAKAAGADHAERGVLCEQDRPAGRDDLAMRIAELRLIDRLERVHALDPLAVDPREIGGERGLEGADAQFVDFTAHRLSPSRRNGCRASPRQLNRAGEPP